MAKWTSYYKIVKPSAQPTRMTDSQYLGDQGSYNNYSWYQRLIQGSASRISRYREYDLMDADVEVARALDTIAEEITGNDPQLDDPLNIKLTIEHEDQANSVAVLTLKTALRKWCKIHDWENRLFKVARITVKYGDCFFHKQKHFQKWAFVHPKNVIAAIVDEHDVTKILAWQIKKDINETKGTYGVPAQGHQSPDQTTIVPASEMVRFGLHDDLSDTAPFGESTLRPAYRAFKQKELIEDSIIIYRVQRAPERRVFYIDVGKMPPQRVKQYLEGIKNEIKQKKVPTINGGKSNIDSVYNPQAMSEDFFFACISLKTNIFLLDGRTLTLAEIMKEFEDGKENWTYSIDQQTGRMIPGKIAWAGYTRRNAEMVRVHLDNDKHIDCTPDHKFVLRDGSEVEAQYLTSEMSLMPLYKKKQKINKNQRKELYERMVDNQSGKWTFTHLNVCPKQEHSGTVIHHIDYNPSNNCPDNLVELTHEDHWKYHHSPNGHTLGRLWRDHRELMISSIRKYHEFRTDEQTQRIVDRNKKNGARTWELHSEEKRKHLDQGRLTTRNKFDTYEKYCQYMTKIGKSQWTEEKRQQRSKQTKHFNKKTKSYNVDERLFDMFVEQFNNGNDSLPKIKTALRCSNSFVDYFKLINSQNQNVTNNKPLKFSDSFVYKIVKHGGYSSFKEFKCNYGFNHKIKKVEWLPQREDTGCLYVIDDKDNHNFAVEAGVYIKNSRPDGRGSRVDTLPGGQNLGELTDLKYFQDRVWRALRVPTSYMSGQGKDGSMFNDGKLGVAYIEELRFSLFIHRIQGHLSCPLDEEFKDYLKKSNIVIDESMYRVRLPDPSNFGVYRQQEMDSALLGAYGTADGIQYLSKRFIMKRFLQMTEEEIIINERMLKEERGLDPDVEETTDQQKLYGEAMAGAEGAGFGGELGGLGGGMGGLGGEELGMTAGGENLPAEEAPPPPNVPNV